MKEIAPSPVYREVRPSKGFLMRHNLSPRSLLPAKKFHPKVKFNLVHLAYTLKKYRPDALLAVGFNFVNFGTDVLLGRMFPYLRLLIKALKTIGFTDKPEFLQSAAEGHTNGPSAQAESYLANPIKGCDDLLRLARAFRIAKG